jgi:hypothetical protein
MKMLPTVTRKRETRVPISENIETNFRTLGETIQPDIVFTPPMVGYHTIHELSAAEMGGGGTDIN